MDESSLLDQQFREFLTTCTAGEIEVLLKTLRAIHDLHEATGADVTGDQMRQLLVDNGWRGRSRGTGGADAR